MFQVQVDCWWSIVFIAEIGWSIYGNSFIYSESNYLCRNEDSEIDANALWISALILICWGYCLMVYMAAIFVFGLGLCCVYRSWNLEMPKQESDLQHRNLSNVPILSTMEAYRIRRYDQHNKRSSSKRKSRTQASGVCGLCMDNCKASDTVLDCHIGHVFHVNCFEK